MSWYMYFFWFGAFVVSINIAFQIYYGNSEISRVDQVKRSMDRANTAHKFETDVQSKMKKAMDKTVHLGIYDTVSEYMSMIFRAINTFIKSILDILFSILSPKLLALIG